MSVTIVGSTPELVGFIMEQLQLAEWPRTLTLATCMRVNSLFNKEAARYLWSRLRNMNAIDTLLHYDTPISGAEIPPSRWQRLEIYAPLVRELEVDTQDHSVLIMCIKRRPGHRLFPNLASFSTPYPFDDSIFKSLMSPRIRRLRYPIPRAANSSFFEFLGTMPLTELGLSNSLYQTSYRLVYSNDLKSAIQKNLKTLEFRNFALSESHFRLIDSLAEIEHLKIHGIPCELTAQDKIATSQILFPKLSSLNLQGASQQFHFIMHDLGIQPKDSLTLYHDEERGMPVLTYSQDLTEALSSLTKFRTFSLKSFSLQGCAGLMGLHQNMIPASVISPLFKFILLEQLLLITNTPIDFADEDIESIVKTLPNLVEVTIGVTTENLRRSYGTKLTPACLGLFAKLSPKLRNLSINVGTQWSELINTGFTSTSTSELSSLHLNHSQVFAHALEVEKIVSILGTLFPRLRNVQFYERPRFTILEQATISEEEKDTRRRIRDSFQGGQVFI
ncbi:hypothetical protein FRC03_005327, partial [Tulasnella sp. 419]